MNKSLNFLLLSVLIVGSSCSQQEIKTNNSETSKTIPVVDSSVDSNDQGLITVSSPYSVSETSDRLEKMINSKSLTLFTRIDHTANAQNVGLELQPTQLIIFGNPQVGTPLMNCSPTTAIDLPQKFLVMQDDSQQTQIVYNSPQYLQQRHEIEGCDTELNKIAGALESIAREAIK